VLTYVFIAELDMIEGGCIPNKSEQSLKLGNLVLWH